MTVATFLIFSGVLLLLGLIYFISSKRKGKICAAALIFFLFSSVFGNTSNFAFWQSDLLYEGESVYNYLQVSENPESVTLSTNVLFGVQSIYMKEDTLTGLYYDYALAAPVLTGYGEKEDFSMLILGMGSGTYASQCEKFYPNASIEGVEIDEKITELARTYFELPEDVNVTTYDGRAYLQGIDQKYDVIMVDAYQDITIPFQMSSVEFFEEVKSHLSDTGVMVVNMNMRSTESGNINEYLTDTIKSVFKEAYTVDVAGSTNRELFAFSDDTKDTERMLTAYEGRADLTEQLGKVAENLQQCQGGGYILTDDKAPVELLGMEVIDSMISEELSYYKQILDEQGVNGLIQTFL